MFLFFELGVACLDAFKCEFSYCFTLSLVLTSTNDRVCSLLQ
jgi:hypothetical protein